MENNYFINSTLVAGVAENGCITTTSNPQEFYFIDSARHEQYILNSLVISVPEDSPYPAKIKLNNLNSYIYIPIGGEESIEGINILKIISISTVGCKFSFKGLSNSFSGNYTTI